MSSINNLEDIRDMEGFDEFNEMFQAIKGKLFGEPEKTKESMYAEAIEKTQKLGIEDLVDMDSLKKAVEDGWKRKTKGISVKDIPDLIGIDDVDDIPEEEIDEELDLHISIYQLGMITSILEHIDSKQIAKAMVEAGLFEPSPINPVKVDDLKESLLEEIDVAKGRILMKALRSHMKEGQKITFTAV